MTTYTLYVHDGRYAVPTLLTIDSRDDDSARAHALRHLESSTHYRAVRLSGGLASIRPGRVGAERLNARSCPRRRRHH